MANLIPAFDFLMDLEGGGVLHTIPGDPGGTTKWGVSQRAHPDVDIVRLDRDGALSIYREQYWAPLRLEQLFNQRVANEVFEFAVNAGLRVATRTAQQAVNDVHRALRLPTIDEDGLIGSQTIGALNYLGRDPVARMAWDGRFNLRQLRFYRSLRRDLVDRFFVGWTRRVID